jgi:hypothetical protein
MLAKDPDARPSMLTVAHSLEIVRAELDQRRTPLPAEPTMRVSRRMSAPHALAPTELAMLDHRRPWHFVVGALAIAASATMFVLTRDTDSAAAATRTPAAAIVEPARPAPARLVQTDPPPPLPLPAAPAAPAVAMPIVRTSAPVKHSHFHTPQRHMSRKAPVTPHRSPLPLDPDGTLDAYR